MLSDVGDMRFSEISSDRNSPQELGFRTFHGTDCGCSSCGRISTHFHCRICGYGTSQTANVVAHRRICISSSDLLQKECSRLTPTTDPTFMQLEVHPSTQSYPYYSPVGPAVSLPPSSTSSGTSNSTVLTTQQSSMFNFVIPTQSSQYSGLYGSQTVFPNSNLFSPSSFNSYGQLDPAWLPQPRLIPPGVHSSSPSSDLLGSGRNYYDKLESSSSPSCCGRIGSIETTALGMCSPLTAEAYKVVSKEFQSKIDSQNWCCNSSSVMNFNSQPSSCKFSDPVPSCSISLLFLEQSDLKSTEECINVDDLCFDTAKTDLKPDVKENQNYSSCMEMSKKSVETFEEPAGKKGKLNVININKIRKETVDLEPHSEDSDIIVEELESDKIHSTATVSSEMKQILLTRCLVCNKSPPEDDDFVKISIEVPATTATTQVSILAKLSQVIEDENFSKFTDCLICPRCLNLINVVDELENKLQSAKKELVDIYKSKDLSVNSLEDLDKQDLTESSPQRKLLCEICNKNFSSANYLEKHKQQHTKVYSYYCEYCGRGFAVLQKLESHLVMHSKSSRFQCELCGKQYNQKQNLMDHLKKHKGEYRYQCEVCQKGFIRSSVYKTHLLTHNSEPCICHQCGKQLKNLSYLYYHIKLCSGDLKYSCNDCDKKFPIKSLLSKHISLKHNSQFEFLCTICKRGFGKKSEMKSHMRSHSDTKPFNCPQCDKTYKSLSNLNQHAKVHSNNQVLECDVCLKKFTRHDSLKDHMNQHTGDKPYKCETCCKAFSHRINYNIHMKRHTGALKQTPCPVCGKMFNKGLKDHLISHSGRKPHTCEHCSATFTVRSSLNKHMKTRHNL